MESHQSSDRLGHPDFLSGDSSTTEAHLFGLGPQLCKILNFETTLYVILTPINLIGLLKGWRIKEIPPFGCNKH